MNTNTWGNFDLVAVQDWTGYQSRQARLRVELDRVGLLDRAKWFWRVPGPFVSKMAAALPVGGGVSMGGFDCTMGHYDIMKLALEWGCRRVLIMEDDVCFAELGALRSAFDRLPADWQFLKLEWYGFGQTKAFENVTCDQPWTRFTSGTVHGTLTGTGAVAFTSEGLRWKTSLIERCLGGEGVPLRTIDMYDCSDFIDDTVAYCATPCLAVQRPHGSQDPHVHAGRKPYRARFLVDGTLQGYPGLRG